jgi:hypothetical protein
MNRLRWIQILFVCALGLFIFASNSNGRATVANSGNTGAPGENTCGQCHSGGSYNASVAIQVFPNGGTVPTTQFVSGNTYTVKVTVSNSMGNPFGYAFQFTALTDAESAPISGYSSLASNVKQKTITVANAFNGRTYLEHNGVTSNNLFQFNWTAPANLNEPVTFFASGNVVNGTGSTAGDATANTSLTLYPAVQVSNDIIQPSCTNNGIGTITLTISGGQAPYNVVWQDGSTGNSIQGGPGSYSALVTDFAGNTATLPAVLNSYTALIVESTSTDVSCFGLCDGNISLNFISGTAPYQILWSDGSVGGNNLPNLCAGVYTAEVTDANGCAVLVMDTIYEPAEITNTPTVTDVPCHGDLGGSIFHNPQGGTEPYTFTWSHDLFLTESSAIYLLAGDYTSTITDFNGCEFSETITIEEPDSLDYSVELFVEGGLGVGEVQITTNGGTPPYQWNWLHGDTNEDTTIPELTTSYCIITDANGCAIQSENFTTITSVENYDFQFELFPQPANETLSISTTQTFERLDILNSTGERIYTMSNPQRMQQINVSEWSAGSYILQLTQSNTRVNRLFLVKH